MRAYIDSDILIWFLRGEKKALKLLERLQKQPEYRLWIGAMQRAEVVFFMRPEEKETTLLFLSMFQTDAVDEEVVDCAAGLYQKWKASHGLDINDAILAATVMLHGGKIFCLNKKHYPMPELLVEKGW